MPISEARHTSLLLHKHGASSTTSQVVRSSSTDPKTGEGQRTLYRPFLACPSSTTFSCASSLYRRVRVLVEARKLSANIGETSIAGVYAKAEEGTALRKGRRLRKGYSSRSVDRYYASDSLRPALAANFSKSLITSKPQIRPYRSFLQRIQSCLSARSSRSNNNRLEKF